MGKVSAKLDELGLRARKRLGQNFLTDRNVLKDIVLAAELKPDDVVIEVGPGLGALTAELAKAAGKVIAVEVDSGLAEALRRDFTSTPHVAIVHGDILKMTPEGLLHEHASGAQAYNVVANLPYYITSPVLRHFLEASRKPKLMVVTVQKEVGETIMAAPGNMSLLSVAVQFYAKPRIVRRVPAGCFFPMPKVDSMVLRLDFWSEPPVHVGDVGRFFEVVRAGFSARRKQLHNPLARRLGLSPGSVASLLQNAGIDPARRAETLSVGEWAIICERLQPDAHSQGARQDKPRSRSPRQATRRLSRDTQRYPER